MTTVSALDEAQVEEVADVLLGHYASGMLTFMIDLGHRTRLFEAAAEGPATSEELAARAGLDERYVREWLGAVVTGGLVDYDPAACVYTLPAEHAVCVTGSGGANLAPVAQVLAHLGKHLEAVAGAFRSGGGVPYSEFRPEFTDVMDALSRGTYDEFLVDEWLPLAPGLHERLQAGTRVADVGCGTGHALVLLAKAFPASSFVGYDIAADAIARARAEAAAEGVRNARFEVRDAADVPADDPFGVVLTLDAVHDQADPVGAVRRIHEALAPGGTYVMVEPAASSSLEDNLANPLAPLLYGISTLHCLTVSLAQGGAGFGTAWGEQRARQLLVEAGFVAVAAHPAPGDPFDTVFVATKAAA